MSDAPTAQVTIFSKTPFPGEADSALLSKRISLSAEGKPVSDGSACRMQAGTAVVARAADAGSLAWLIEGMLPCNALALGSIVGGNGATMNVVTAAALAKLPAAQRGNTTIARTREFITFRAGAPAWMLLDYDLKGMPAHVAAKLDATGGLWRALLGVAPGLARAARVVRASTSAGLSRSDTGERFPSSGGSHTYLLVEDGADIDRTLETLHNRCWLHGLGWFLIGSAGQLLERSVVDAAVRFSERLVFEGRPDIVPPLLQDAEARRPQATEGEPLATRITVPDLTCDEAAQVEAAKLAARRTLEPNARAVCAAADGHLIEEIVRRTGVPHAVAMRQAQARHRGILGADIQLVTDHHGMVTVRQILADPDAFIGETLPDPLEGTSYGWGKAIVMRSQREPGRVFINSFAHGGATFDLKHDCQGAPRGGADGCTR